ncbi:MerR family transcriptional regulator [Celeribacter neptunius]|uniref:MerR HTH family regulatory protein n=1 Tax=Celeribacter neptunius TaxID=588602 RepID=A0A1I3KC57_9RHOB|nr:MerR family transcriptional regulator [Celeribacter neptunius]SFI70037.1 MerR HTH family regulatory protein [Celeribacter neptunius]
MNKSPDAFRTISEVADWLDTPAHVLRFWESRFTQVKPVKRAGGRRYYRPADMALLGGIKKLLHDDGMTIRGVQKLLREHGVRYVASLSPVIEGVEPIVAPAPDSAPIPSVPPAPMAEMVPQDDFDDLSEAPEETVVPFSRPAAAQATPLSPAPQEQLEATTAENLGEILADTVEPPATAADSPDEDLTSALEMNPHGFEPPAHVIEEETLAETSAPEDFAAAFEAGSEAGSEASFETAADIDSDLTQADLTQADLTGPVPADEINEPAPESLFALRAEQEETPDAPKAPSSTAADTLPGQTAFDFADLPADRSEDHPASEELSEEESALEAESLAEYEMPAPELVPHDTATDLAAELAGLTSRTELADLADLSDLDETTKPAPDETERQMPGGTAGAAEAAGQTASAAPLGAALHLPPDPDDNDPAILAGGGVLGLLNARKLSGAEPEEIAGLLSRSEMLRARLAG